MLDEFLNLSEDEDLQKSLQDLRSNQSGNSKNFSGYVSSFSSSISNQNSSESVDVEKIMKKTKEIKEQIANRLSAFIQMSEKCCQEDEEELNVGKIEDFKNSCEKIATKGYENPDEVELRNIIEQISELQKEFKVLEKRLWNAKDEILNVEQEEKDLKNHMDAIERNLSRFIIETSEKKSSCDCVLM